MEKKGVTEITEILVHEAGIILSDQTEEITAGASLADLGFDSMSFIDLLVSIEKKFGIKLIEIGMQPEDIKTLEALAHYIYQAT